MSQTTSDRPNYKKTLNLPKTRFAMKANLVQREPRFQERWATLDVYRRLREVAAGRPAFVLHDGPPYANGSIHLGHLLNKVLKDIVVRSRSMLGFDAPFVPGWDCHGLPIEHMVVQKLGERAADMTALQVRKRCQDYAEKWVKQQAKEMKRLGVIGDFGEPYLTMAPEYEAATLEVFAGLVERELVYRALRPVHWSIANRTALADAELEHLDREDDSIYVLLELENPSVLPHSLEVDRNKPVHLMVWTTTPWTLPANVAVAVGASAEYGLFRFVHEGVEHQAIVASALKEAVFDRFDVKATMAGHCTGGLLEDARPTYRHPFIDRTGVVVTADYVTLEDGTGLVHTAPGHGADDFYTGKKHDLEVVCPVGPDGCFDESVPQWLVGKSVWDANPQIIERLRESRHLFRHTRFVHSYPHDWRSKTPTIFRATDQWFVDVDHEGRSMRQLGIDAAHAQLRFYPEWGRNRLTGMLQSRPDWCISRQRMWGLPIPAFFDEEERVLLTPASVRAVAATLAREGSDLWFRADAATLLAGYDPQQDADAPEWLRGGDVPVAELHPGRDIFDVWFESGSSWFSVAERRGLGVPVDLYLEGSDQHRGWFQLSLLTALGLRGAPPFRAILTHGFIVDRQGKKMSKSTGNALQVDDLMKQFGADVCRWWVCSLNVDHDVKADVELFKLAGEEYRKVRNTIRFLLSNLGDFQRDRDGVALDEIDRRSVDAWALDQLATLVERTRAGYEAYDLRRVHESIFNFCNDTLSAVYLSAVKDRLYCDVTGAPRRRRTQTVLHEIASALTRMIAPLVPHTADEAWLALAGDDPDRPGTEACVHLELLPTVAESVAATEWTQVMALRERVLKRLEEMRGAGTIANPLDAGVVVTLDEDLAAALTPFSGDLADLCGVSRFAVQSAGEQSITIEDLSEEPRCDRSWKRDGTVRERSDGGWLTDRDAEAVGVS